MIETLFVIFPPGLGGNHLANLISLTDRFSRPVDYSLYDSTATDAHFNTIKNLQEHSLREHPELLEQSSVLTGHLAEYIWLQDRGFADQFKNRKFLVVLFPEKNSLAYKRMASLYPYFDDEYYYHEYSAIYSQRMLERMLNEHDFFQVSADLIFSDDTDALFDFIEEEFYTTLNREFAKEVHLKWLNKIKLSLANS